MDREEKEFVGAVKDLKRMKRNESLGKVLRSFGNVIPKGVRDPDSLVRNQHLYIPGKRGKTRLF